MRIDHQRARSRRPIRVSPSGGAFAAMSCAELCRRRPACFDDRLAPEAGAKLGGDDPGDAVGRAARRERRR